MTICLAYAPTAPGHAALRRCVAEATTRQTDVVVVNAVRDWDDATPVELTSAEHAALAHELERAGLSWRWYDGPHGLSGADEILTAAEDPSVSLIVIGVTDRAHTQKRIVSDTTKHVLLDAQCDVLAVRADQCDPA